MSNKKHNTGPVDPEKLLSDEAAFEDGLPVVAAFIRTGRSNVIGHNSVDAQKERIIAACRNRFARGCHIFFIAEDGAQKRGTSHDLRQIMHLVKKGVLEPAPGQDEDDWKSAILDEATRMAKAMDGLPIRSARYHRNRKA